MSRTTRRNLLIAFFLLLAAVQIVRSDFFTNHELFNWRLYGDGKALMPYQGRIGMMPVIHWAGHSHAMQSAAARYQGMLSAGSPIIEPITPEKFASMLAGIAAMLLMIAAAAWYGATHMRTQWWLPSVLVLAIAMVTLDARLEHNLWYPYDLPHAALFGLAVVCALQRRWLLTLLLFLLDVPVRETALFLLPIVLPLFWLNEDEHRASLLQHKDWTALRRAPRTLYTLLAGIGMFLYWELIHLLIQHHFAANIDETGTRFSRNLHEILLPHHWSQLFSAGGYLVLFIWLERKHLPLPERIVLYGTLLCAPAVLYFSIWNETRVWLEWTVPLAIAGATELHNATQPLVISTEAKRSGETRVTTPH